MKLINVMSKLMNEPWVILASQHSVLVETVKTHMQAGKNIIRAEDDPITEMMTKEPDPLIERRGNIALVKLQGIMGGYRLSNLEMACGACDVGRVAAAVNEAVADESIKGIALFVDSPGGMVTGVAELAETIKAATNSKPLIAYTDTCIASGAMWAVAGADEIWSTDSAMVGSIGAYLALLDTSKYYEMNGFKRERIRSGKFKGAGMDGCPLSEDERADFQKRTDGIAARFRDWVKANRPAVQDDSLEGQVFYGYEAVEKGLVDGIKTESQVLAHLGEIIGMMER